MKKVSNEFVNLSKKVKTQDLKLTINNGELTVQEVHLMPANIFNAIPISRLRARKEVIAKELKYSFEGQLFKTIMQQVNITVKNASEIKGKNVIFQYGILVNDEFEYIDMGEYYVKDVEDDKNKEELVVTGYDKMINFMKLFKQSDLNLTYPCKMGQLVSRMGEICGVELYSTDFYNSGLVVEEDFFTAQELTYRDVLEKVAQTTLTTIFIKENKLYLCKIGDSVQTLDTSFLSNLVIGEKFGPVNALVLGRGSVEDNVEAVNQQSINTSGRCEIRFDENEFIDNKREQIIDEMLQQINGLEYYSIEASNLGILWLEPCDVIIVKDREESEYKTIYLKANITINTGIKGEMEANIPETATTEYKVTTKEEKKTLKVERLAKKNEGLIQDLIEQNTETTNKLSQHEQTIDSITDTISSVEITLENDYYNKTETNAQIQAKADSITTSVTKQISTAKSEAIDNANESTDKKLEDYTVTSKLGTFIEQNWEYIKYAWNQISQYLKMEGIDGKATLNIYDENNNMLMSLSQDGQTFYDTSGNKIGTVGIVRENDKDTLAFAMNVDWDNVSESKSMAWGFFDKNGKFLPIFNLLSYYGQDTSEYGGELSVAGILGVGEEIRVEKGTILFGSEGTGGSLDGHNGNLIYTSDGEIVAYISKEMLILGNYITGYKNELGGYTISCEYFNASNVPNTDNISIISGSGGDYGFIHANINDGTYVRVYASNSDRNLKKNIKATRNKGIEKINKINHYEFDWKLSGNHQEIGYIAQEMKEIDSNFVHYSKYTDASGQEKENWQINTLSVLATATKAIQEQQEEIERLKEKDKQKDEIIANLITRIEKLERGE